MSGLGGEMHKRSPKEGRAVTTFDVTQSSSFSEIDPTDFGALVWHGVSPTFPYTPGTAVPEVLKNLHLQTREPLQLLAGLSVGLREYLETIPGERDVDKIVEREEKVYRIMIEAIQKAASEMGTVLLWDLDDTLIQTVILNSSERDERSPCKMRLLRFGVPWILEYAKSEFPNLRHGILSSRSRESLDRCLEEGGALEKFQGVFDHDFLRSCRLFFYHKSPGWFKDGDTRKEPLEAKMEDEWKGLAAKLGMNSLIAPVPSFEMALWLSKMAIMEDLQDNHRSKLMLVDDWDLANYGGGRVFGGAAFVHQELLGALTTKIDHDLVQIHLRAKPASGD